MGEIIWTHTQPDKNPGREHRSGSIETDTKITIFESPDKVALVHSSLVKGIARPKRITHDEAFDFFGKPVFTPLTDKYYYTWVTTASIGLRRTKAGTVVPYAAFRPYDKPTRSNWSHREPLAVFAMLNEPASESEEVFRAACRRSLGIEHMYDLYPFAEQMGLDDYRLLPANLRVAMRQTTPEAFCAAAYGKTRVTPRLINASLSREPYVLSLAREFRGLVPDEDMTSLVETNEFDDELMENFKPHTPAVRPLLYLLPEGSRKALTKDSLTVANTQRIMRLAEVYKPRKNNHNYYRKFKDEYKSWVDLSRW